MLHSSPKDLLLEAYIAAHWEFKINPKYHGLLGWLRAKFDRRRIEERESYNSGPAEHIGGDVYGSSPGSIEAFRKQYLDENSFADAMMRYITKKNLDPADVYHKAGIDRRLFSKIRSYRDYRPAKKTILALCIAMELDLEESKDLLGVGGFALSRNILTDVIVEYFLISKKYNIFEVNETLSFYDLPPLS